ncbi:MAG: hypothetical protein C4535_12950 [Comamonadaceae bacterium]|nr:MAG: hypothetical protein C4535_12950 [Comamonadaceae bacterium]
MTTFALFKLFSAVVAMAIGVVWILRRTVPVTSDNFGEVFHYIKGWDAVVTGIAVFAFGLALLLDALGVVVWIGEW